MTRALVGAGGSVACLALIALEALAHSVTAVADSSARALGITMELSSLVGRVNPSKLERTNTIRAITRLHGEAYAPVIIAVTDIIHGAESVAAATVVAVGTD